MWDNHIYEQDAKLERKAEIYVKASKYLKIFFFIDW